jgi:hypothetical protein
MMVRTLVQQKSGSLGPGDPWMLGSMLSLCMLILVGEPLLLCMSCSVAKKVLWP